MHSLPKAARYFPLEKGVYEVAPGLRPLGQDLGNGERDGLIFQLDEEFPKYRQNKLECRKERLGKYFCTNRLSLEQERAICRFVAERLAKEHPDFFKLSGGELRCELTQERLRFSSPWDFLGADSAVEPPYASGLDALASQVQEDITLMSKAADGSDWLAFLHLCAPSHWAAEDKVGKNFFAIHQPIPGIEKINRAAAAMVDAMIHKGPYVRFVWGFGTDQRLNHHPEPAPGWTKERWQGRSFQVADDGQAPFILRMERQTVWGLPEVNASLFFIRVYFLDGRVIKGDQQKRGLLKSALLSMNPESLRYKSIEKDLPSILAWLESST